MAKNKVKKLDDGKLSGRTWFNLCIFGLTGSIAWNLENMYYNTFVYNTIYEGGTVALEWAPSSMDIITLMVNLSAVVAVVTALVIGNYSDKIKKRKVFISVGYILWGITCIIFGLINKENIQAFSGLSNPDSIVAVTAVCVVIMDCLMTFMGSTSHDAAFNAWITDVTTHKNRATVESVLSILPYGAMIIVLLGGGAITALGGGNLTAGYQTFFSILGVFIVLCGIVGLFTLQDSVSDTKSTTTMSLSDILYGFRPSVIKGNSRFYITLCAVCLYCIALQCFFPFLFIYLDHGLGLKIDDLLGYITPKVLIAIPIVILFVVGCFVLIGRLVDKMGKKLLMFLSNFLFAGGLIAAYFAKTPLIFGLCAIPALIGYSLTGIVHQSSLRDFTPKDKAGLFQGVRMVFNVLVPMIVGPQIGNAVCKYAGSGSYIDEGTGLTQAEPCAEMFLAAGIISILVLVPLVILAKKGIDVVEE